MKSNKTEETYLKLYLGTLQRSALSCNSQKKKKTTKAEKCFGRAYYVCLPSWKRKEHV